MNISYPGSQSVKKGKKVKITKSEHSPVWFHSGIMSCKCVALYSYSLLILIFTVCSPLFFMLLTPWRLGGFGDFRKKNSSFRLPYQHPSSSTHCARELFNGSSGSASPVDCTRKKFLLGGCRFFGSDVISGGPLGQLGPLCLALGANR